MQKIDELLDQALRQIKNGESISQVLSNAPQEYQQELKAMLEVIALISALPLKNVPSPNKRRLYLQAQQPAGNFAGSWFKFGEFLRVWRVAPVALGVFVLTVAASALAASSSLPGDRFFALKKAVESARLSLTTN